MSVYDEGAKGADEWGDSAASMGVAAGLDAEIGQSVGQNGLNGASEGVTALASKPAKVGRWKKGESGNPSGLRKMSGTIIRAIYEDSPPERIIGMLNQLEDIAIAQRSWRGMAEALRIRLEDTEGKPIQRTMTVQAKLGSMLERMAGVTVDADVVREVVSDDGE
jgi:hypothetical protein